MKDLQIFRNPEFGSIRTLDEEGKVLFCASDVAKALGYSNAPDAVKRHCRYIVKRDIPHPQAPDKTIEVIFIPEGDVYRLITHSNLPDAEKFEHWLFDDMLPTLRKTGSYSITPKMDSLQALNLLVKSLNEQQDAMNRLQVNVDAQSAAIEKLEDRTELMQQAFALDLNDWRKNAKSVVGSIVLKKTGGDMKDSQPIWEETWNEVYDRMDSKFHRKMKQRLENLRKRTGNKKLNMLDAIDRADNGDRARLISELNTVLTEMCIYYGVRLDMDKAKNLTNRHEDSQTSLFDRNCAPAGKLMDAREAAARG